MSGFKRQKNKNPNRKAHKKRAILRKAQRKGAEGWKKEPMFKDSQVS